MDKTLNLEAPCDDNIRLKKQKNQNDARKPTLRRNQQQGSTKPVQIKKYSLNVRNATEQSDKISRNKISKKKFKASQLVDNQVQKPHFRSPKNNLLEHGKSKHQLFKDSKKKRHSTQGKIKFFSPKQKNLNLSHVFSTTAIKSTLKKVSKNDVRATKTKNEKVQQEQHITPFKVPLKHAQKQELSKPSTDVCLTKKSAKENNVKSRQNKNQRQIQKKLHRKQLSQSPKHILNKGKHMKTLQNENTVHSKKQLTSKNAQNTKKNHQNNESDTLPFKKPKKLYHNLKMKTQQSFMSCESTPSEIVNDQVELLELIGQGTFGKVFKAKIKKTGQTVAIKRVFQDRKYKNREIEIVQLLDSPFITKMLGTYKTYEKKEKQYLNIVMEYYQTDLYRIIDSTTSVDSKQLTDLQTKLYIYQMFRGLLYLHSKNICHRDIKPHNMLVDPSKKTLVLCDFGSAKVLSPDQKNLPYICSRCYRAPQLIFGSTQYTTMIDIWSVGCVILQIIGNKPLFIGNSSIDHLIQVIKILGTPTKTQVKQMNPEYDLNDYKFPNIKKVPFKKIFQEKQIDPLLISLLEQIMLYAPKQRLNAAQALVHQYFDELRTQQTFQKLTQNNFNIPNIYQFSMEELAGNEHLYGQLIPEWFTGINRLTNFESQQTQLARAFEHFSDC